LDQEGIEIKAEMEKNSLSVFNGGCLLAFCSTSGPGFMQLGEDLTVSVNHTCAYSLTLFLEEKLEKREGLRMCWF